MKEDSCFAPVWISLPKLPLQCFIPEFLESVANNIGRFLCFDKATSTLARPSTARICVEIDLRRSPPPVIWVGLFEGFKQQIIYERLPKYCNHCHIIGHVAEECHKVGLVASQGHTVAECPTGQREATSKQAEPHPSSISGCTPSARQNAPRKSAATSVLRTASSPSKLVSSTPPPPPPPPNPPPPPPPNPDPPPPNPNPSPNPIASPGASSTPSIANQSTPKHAHQPPVTQPKSNPMQLQSAALDLHLASPSQQHNSPKAAPPPAPQTSSTFQPAAARPPISSSQIQPSDSSSRCLPAAAALYTPQGPAHPPFMLPSAAAASQGSALLCQQSNREVNHLFWDAVNRHLALNGQARLKIPSVDTSNSTLSIRPPEDNNLPLHISAPHGSQSEGDSSPRSSVAADSQPNSPSTYIQGAHNHYGSANNFSYNSEGEEPTTEPTYFHGHNTDDLLWQRPRKAKRNKRHPDKPLNVQLRARKAHNPRPLC